MYYKTIAFTGHRPDKLGGYDFDTPKNRNIMRELTKLIEQNEADHYICGGALGVDMMALEICYELRRKLNCTIEVAVPFEEQTKYYKDNHKELYRTQLIRANKVTQVDKLTNYYGGTINAKLQRRNEYMVDNADLIIAVWDGSKGGTKNCIDYALSKYKKVIVLNPHTLQVTTLENNQLKLF